MLWKYPSDQVKRTAVMETTGLLMTGSGELRCRTRCVFLAAHDKCRRFALEVWRRAESDEDVSIGPNPSL